MPRGKFLPRAGNPNRVERPGKRDQRRETSHTVLELLGGKHSLRVEWYIVTLIVAVLVIRPYTIFSGWRK
jgi:hypothetical protein